MYVVCVRQAGRAGSPQEKAGLRVHAFFKAQKTAFKEQKHSEKSPMV
jgi:hypothetical protein